MPGPRPSVSVVIPVFDQAQFLERCLEALGHQTLGRGRFEVLVVDNGSASPPTALCRRHRARLLHQTVPGSYAARNLGAAQSRSSLLAFTDADCLPRPDWLAQALAVARKQPHASAWGGRIDVPLGPQPTAVERLDAHWGRNQRHWVERESWADSANLMVRRGAFRRAGGFDQVLSHGDRLFGRRLRGLDLRLAYAPDAAVTHPPLSRLRHLIRRQRRMAGGYNEMPDLKRTLLKESLLLLSGPLHPAWEYFRSDGPRRHGRLLEFVALRSVARAVQWGEWIRLGLGGRPERR